MKKHIKNLLDRHTRSSHEFTQACEIGEEVSEDDKQPKPLYWICNNCALEKAWTVPDGCVTCIKGVCGYCNGDKQTEEFLTPICDYTKPGQKYKLWD